MISGDIRDIEPGTLGSHTRTLDKGTRGVRERAMSGEMRMGYSRGKGSAICGPRGVGYVLRETCWNKLLF